MWASACVGEPHARQGPRQHLGCGWGGWHRGGPSACTYLLGFSALPTVPELYNKKLRTQKKLSLSADQFFCAPSSCRFFCAPIVSAGFSLIKVSK